MNVQSSAFARQFGLNRQFAVTKAVSTLASRQAWPGGRRFGLTAGSGELGRGDVHAAAWPLSAEIIPVALAVPMQGWADVRTKFLL